ncbi:MAG: hypothetical protein LBM75_08785 [Myxococcales bacterium]|jgi:polyhydroxyalkanoate synthesis regulator phasin|nr:hypothetical protein [Myxococcales bacterium]
MFTESPFVRRVFEIGEDQLNRVVQQLLTSDKFVAAIQSVVNNSLKAKGLFDKNLRIALSAMSLPTISDMDNLRLKLDELDQAIQRIELAVGHLSDKDKPVAEKSPKPRKSKTS